MWAAGPASAVRVWDASHLTDALERVLGGPCRPIKATEIGKGLFIPLPLFSAASLIKSRSPWGKGGRSSPRAPAQQALRPAGLPEADSAAQKEGLSLSGLSPRGAGWGAVGEPGAPGTAALQATSPFSTQEALASLAASDRHVEGLHQHQLFGGKVSKWLHGTGPQG